MSMLTPFDTSLALLIILGLPLRAYFSMRRLKRAEPQALARVRPRLYAFAMLTQWSLALAVVALWIAERRSWTGLGLELRLGGGLLGVLAGLFTISLMLWRQRASIEREPELRERVRARLAGVEKLLPTNDRESTLFAALSVTAGVCEELLFRGFLFWLFTHFLPFWGAAALQAVLFGIGHAYQGPKGIVATTLAGIFLTGVLIVSGSLYAPMLVHALMDLNAGDMGRRAFAEPGSAPA
ncbi:MAG: CPBP family intramembrane glutamic endopeptidase [Candidatus Eisenbacteria bacterium]